MIKLIGGPFDGCESEWTYCPWGEWPPVIFLRIEEGELFMSKKTGHPYFKRNDIEYVSSDVDMNVIDEKEFAFA